MNRQRMNIGKMYRMRYWMGYRIMVHASDSIASDCGVYCISKTDQQRLNEVMMNPGQYFAADCHVILTACR